MENKILTPSALQELLKELNDHADFFDSKQAHFIIDSIRKKLLSLSTPPPPAMEEGFREEIILMLQKSISELEEKEKAFLGVNGEPSRQGFKSGLRWGISSIDYIIEKIKETPSLPPPKPGNATPELLADFMHQNHEELSEEFGWKPQDSLGQ